MEFIKTKFDGLFEIKNDEFKDCRGSFVKTFHENTFHNHGLEIDFKEGFYSVSNKNVLRGMHYQIPPSDHNKLVYVTDGAILDVALDIRKDSKTYGKYFSTELSNVNKKSLYMGKGFAHGFLTLSDMATVMYLTSTVHSPECDKGILWSSFGFEWPVDDPIMSERDKSFVPLIELT